MIGRLSVVAVVGTLALAGCGGSSNKSSSAATATPKATKTPSSSGSGAGGGGKLVTIGADPGGALRFTKKTLTAKAGTVEFGFSNPSQTPHAFEIEGHGVEKATKVITGATAGLTVKLKPGKYEFYCPVDGHKAAGMRGTLTVQ